MLPVLQCVSVDSSITKHPDYGSPLRASSEAINDHVTATLAKPPPSDMTLTSSSLGYGRYNMSSADTVGASSDNSADTKTSRSALLQPSSYRAPPGDGIARVYCNPPPPVEGAPQPIEGAVPQPTTDGGGGRQKESSAFVRKIKKASVTLKSLHHMYRDYLQKEREEAYARRQRHPADEPTPPPTDVAAPPPPTKTTKTSKSKERRPKQEHRSKRSHHHHQHQHHHHHRRPRDRSGDRRSGSSSTAAPPAPYQGPPSATHRPHGHHHHARHTEKARAWESDFTQHSRSIPTIVSRPEVHQPLYSHSEYRFMPPHGALHM
ncbi:PREDICTED: death-associated protein kinase related-like [Priapulus caudatus]|uniref:Death-associated protein kinase related-like n=1 Tax=Priapulus caudatus TaxID=37621 RepID=A0ABM1EX81_PRICU|nr:PREDICTED: death-associated protein kinase related-like [Priapulus caudatus]